MLTVIERMEFPEPDYDMASVEEACLVLETLEVEEESQVRPWLGVFEHSLVVWRIVRNSEPRI